MRIPFSILLAAIVSLSNASGVIWLEAERFSQAGGWSTDTQFVDTMGSVQLLATGCGKPVDDAVTQAAAPRISPAWTGSFRPRRICASS
jgi:hypothetical protein